MFKYADGSKHKQHFITLDKDGRCISSVRKKYNCVHSESYSKSDWYGLDSYGAWRCELSKDISDKKEGLWGLYGDEHCPVFCKYYKVALFIQGKESK